MNNHDLEIFKSHIHQVQFFASKVQGISIVIEKPDPNYVYFIHTTSLDSSDIDDVYRNGISYSENDLWRVFHNLSKGWVGSNPFREKADKTSMEQVVVESCKKMSFQCFVYKIPLCFFENTGNHYYSISIWMLDRNENYSTNFVNSNGIYDKQQLFFLKDDKRYSSFWQYNQFILEGVISPYTPLIDEITRNYQMLFLENVHK